MPTYPNKHTCAICGASLTEEALLRFNNMPAAAQHLPDAPSVKGEKGEELEIRQCSGCGLVQLTNEPVFYYREVIRATAFSPEMKRFRKKQFSKFIKEFSLRGKRIIEIGSGRGENLPIVSGLGADSYGLEYSQESVKQAKKNGLSVRAGFVEDENYKIAGAPFDAFYSFNFLEHWPRPSASLRGISNNLRAGAVGIVEVPNFDMMLKKHLFSEFVVDHLFYYTKDTLETVLRLSGFEVLSIEPVWHEYIISALVRKRGALDMASFSKQQKKIKDDVAGFLKRFPAKGVAIWGAGHQAFFIISALGLAGKIRYVVDSAPFKQNKFTPATDVPIVAPERLYKDNVGAVIIITGSFSDEVKKIIRGRFNQNIKIAILRDFGLEVSN